MYIIFYSYFLALCKNSPRTIENKVCVKTENGMGMEYKFTKVVAKTLAKSSYLHLFSKTNVNCF